MCSGNNARVYSGDTWSESLQVISTLIWEFSWFSSLSLIEYGGIVSEYKNIIYHKIPTF
jgi:hypothetical protein